MEVHWKKETACPSERKCRLCDKQTASLHEKSDSAPAEGREHAARYRDVPDFVLRAFPALGSLTGSSGISIPE